jgi:hypothetical protein
VRRRGLADDDGPQEIGIEPARSSAGRSDWAGGIDPLPRTIHSETPWWATPRARWKPGSAACDSG